MPQNHVQTHAQNHGKVCPPENKDQKKNIWGAAPDPNGGDCFAPRDPPATPDATYSVWG